MRVIQAITRVGAIQNRSGCPRSDFLHAAATLVSPFSTAPGFGGPISIPRAHNFRARTYARLGTMGDHRALHPISIAVKAGGGAGRPAPLVLKDKQPLINVLDQLLPMSLD
jgi:hypothetical protein